MPVARKERGNMPTQSDRPGTSSESRAGVTGGGTHRAWSWGSLSSQRVNASLSLMLCSTAFSELGNAQLDCLVFLKAVKLFHPGERVTAEKYILVHIKILGE